MAKLILIGGVSRSGKSRLAKALQLDLPNAHVFHQDEFVLPDDQIPPIRDRIDWERPESMDWNRLLDAYELANTKYEYIIIEGIFAFSNAKLNQSSDFTVLLTLDKEKFLERRKKEKRWGKEPDWFIEHVWKSHERFHNPHNISPNCELPYPNPADYSEILAQLKS
ncbi:hypothetical protein BFP97_01950 [Roseivirga sp. 4D4]|uniref:AAA family ATPase n=1 Tax=Roseivirga sp. 4D4 TaxID=1889784 RepID=UPI0008530383|nr:AAA family ATPase [Roseivirga sp. 4D4]OEK00348.1 hypothetical protein BFP97_01950 [Roseivirga sp. 4D4]